MNTDNTQHYTRVYHLTADLTVHAVLVEVVEEVSLLRLVDAGQHVLRVQQCPDYAHQLHSSAAAALGVVLNDDGDVVAEVETASSPAGIVHIVVVVVSVTAVSSSRTLQTLSRLSCLSSFDGGRKRPSQDFTQL